VTLEQEQQFLYLTTKGWKTGRQHEVEIWFVSYDDKYYLISERKEKAHWVQNIMHNPRTSQFIYPDVSYWNKFIV
jgi:F420H(2)-dependent quinone reductase